MVKWLGSGLKGIINKFTTQATWLYFPKDIQYIFSTTKSEAREQWNWSFDSDFEIERKYDSSKSCDGSSRCWLLYFYFGFWARLAQIKALA